MGHTKVNFFPNNKLFLECESFHRFNGEGKMSSMIENFNLVVHLAVKHSALDSLIPADQIKSISPKKKKKQVIVAGKMKRVVPRKIPSKLASKVGLKTAECKLCRIAVSTNNFARHRRMCEIKNSTKARSIKVNLKTMAPH